jgi:hypothetical protein
MWGGGGVLALFLLIAVGLVRVFEAVGIRVNSCLGLKRKFRENLFSFSREKLTKSYKNNENFCKNFLENFRANENV